MSEQILVRERIAHSAASIEHEAGGRPLNVMDETMLAANRALRAFGASGFETQALLWLRGRVDAAALRQAIVQLSLEHPVICSRLVATGRGGAEWRFRPGASCPLHEHDLQDAHSLSVGFNPRDEEFRAANVARVGSNPRYESSDERAVLDEAARLLSRPRLLESDDPIRFHLLHLPEGRDVFLMQYNHALMDNTTPPQILREIDRLASAVGQDCPTHTFVARSPDPVAARSPDRATGPTEGLPDDVRELRSALGAGSGDPRTTEALGAGSGDPRTTGALGAGSGDPRTTGDLLEAYRARFSLRKRLRAAWRITDLRLRSLRGTVVGLGRDVTDHGPHARRLHIARRFLNESETRALQARVVRACGFPGISMAMLGSAFRAMSGVIEKIHPSSFILHRSNDRRNYVAGIGLDLGLRGTTGPLFQNLVSVVPIHARPDELADKHELTRRLNARMRARLQREIDLGVIELAGLFRRWPRFVDWWTRRMLRQGYSLWYAYFTGLEAVGERFCGAGVDDLSYVGPSWPPVGLTLLVSQFRGRLCFQTTSVSASVPPEVAEAFLDRLIEDLVHTSDDSALSP